MFPDPDPNTIRFCAGTSFKPAVAAPPCVESADQAVHDTHSHDPTHAMHHDSVCYCQPQQSVSAGQRLQVARVQGVAPLAVFRAMGRNAATITQHPISQGEN